MTVDFAEFTHCSWLIIFILLKTYLSFLVFGLQHFVLNRSKVSSAELEAADITRTYA